MCFFHQPQISVRLATHAESAPPDAVADQQAQLLKDFVIDLPDHTVQPSDIPLVTPPSSTTSPIPTFSPENISPSIPTPAPNPNPIPTSSPDSSHTSPTPLRTVQFDVPDSDQSDSSEPSPTIPPDPPPTFVSPQDNDSDSSSSTSRRRAQAPRPCFHRPPRSNDDIAVKWHYDDGSSVWLPARVSTHQSRKKPIKDLHGNVLPQDTTFVIEDLSTPERPLYTKQLIEADHGVTWQYALQPHPRSLHRRLQLYSAPHPLFHLAARTAYTAICNTHSTLVLPFVERFRQDLQNSAFFAALLHLNVNLTAPSGSQATDHSSTSTPFASTQHLLKCYLTLSFTDSVPLHNHVISPSLYADVSQATNTAEFIHLGGNTEHLHYLLHHGHVDIAAVNDSAFAALPANVQATLQSGIDQDRYQLLCSADTTQDFRILGGTQAELEYLLRHDHLLLDSHPADFLSAVDASSSSLDYAPTVRFARVDEELRKQGYYLHHDEMDTSPTDRLFTASHYESPEHASPRSDSTAPPPQFDPSVFFESGPDADFDALKDQFWRDFDPNQNIRSQLDELNYEQLHSIHLVFEPTEKLKGDGRNVDPDDFVYDPETIVEIKHFEPDQKRRHLEAIIKEMTGCADQGVVRISLVPDGRRAIPTKLVVRVKHDATGAYERHKARWVALGFLARSGLDFSNTYAPTSMLTTGRLLFAIAARYGLNVSHADLPQAFLQSPIDRPIWVTLPKGISLKHDTLAEFRRRHPRGTVALRLLKSLYGLQSSPALFSKTVSQFMTSLGYTRSRSDSTLYYFVREDESGQKIWVLVSVFVDDLLLCGTDEESRRLLKAKLEETFGRHSPVTWNETVTSFLGLHVSCNETHTQWRLSAAHKIRQLLESLDMQFPHKGVKAPWKSEFATLHKTQDVPLTPRQLKIREKFRTIAGTLIYVSITVRPDITTVLNRACQGMANPTRQHIVLLERTLEYLASNPDLGLVYNADGSPLSSEIVDVLASKYKDLKHLRNSPYLAFSDADFASLNDPRLRSTSGHAIFCFSCLIHWSSKRQTLTAKSTLESELIAASSAADECAWLHSLASTLLFIFGTNSEDPTHAPPVPVLLDNTAALSVANHPKQTPRSRHISLREFRIRDYCGDNNHVQCIRCLWVPTKFNVADFFTKLLASVDFPRLARFLVNAPYNAIADADISVGDHHPSRLPQDFHSSSRAAFVLTDEDAVVMVHLDIVTPIPYDPGVSSTRRYAHGGVEDLTLALGTRTGGSPSFLSRLH